MSHTLPPVYYTNFPFLFSIIIYLNIGNIKNYLTVFFQKAGRVKTIKEHNLPELNL